MVPMGGSTLLGSEGLEKQGMSFDDLCLWESTVKPSCAPPSNYVELCTSDEEEATNDPAVTYGGLEDAQGVVGEDWTDSNGGKR